MQDTLLEEQVKKIASFNGIDVYKINAEKFKTNSINIFFQDYLSKENATKNALLPAVLRRGCQRFKTYKEIALYMEELYGASFDCGVNKKGEQQIIQYYIDCILDQYTEEKSGLLEKAFDILFEIVANPYIENDAFKKEYVDQEKENLKNIIEGRVNDKVQYAVDKCLEEMCQGEPFEVLEYGSVNELNAINPVDLYKHYQYIMKSLPMKVFIAGDIGEDRIKKIIEKLKGLERDNIKSIEPTKTEKQVGAAKYITDRMNVNQGKLSIGFRTNTAPHDTDYYSLIVCNSILGGGIHSKLFQNVREKEGLAYYSFSRLEKFKGLMVISCGIEIQNKDKATDVILQQVEEIKKGNITDYEFQSSVKSIQTGVESLKDSQLQIVDFYLSQTIVNTNDTLNKLIENIKKVTKEDVVKVVQKIKQDTVYFLTSKES